MTSQPHRHRPKTETTEAYSCPVRYPENPAAHGNVCHVAVCRCGAIRWTNVNGRHVERSEWRHRGLQERPMIPSPTWLDIMPAIPLARGVPCIAPRSGVRFICLDVAGDYIRTDVAQELVAALVRVDLDDPQGFGYALRWFGQQVPWLVPNHPSLPGTRGRQDYEDSRARKRLYSECLYRHIAGETTDADRLALAWQRSAVVAEWPP